MMKEDLVVKGKLQYDSSQTRNVAITSYSHIPVSDLRVIHAKTISVLELSNEPSSGQRPAFIFYKPIG